MSECVWARIILRECDLERARALGAELHDEFEGEQGQYLGDGLVSFSDPQANYGNFDCEEDLREAGIPYDKEFDSGPDWQAGIEVFRPGEPLKQFSTEEFRLKRLFLETLVNIILGRDTIQRVTEELRNEVDFQLLTENEPCTTA